MTTYEVLFFVALIAIYTLIQRNIAINRRENLAKTVDEYLSKDNDAPEKYKELVYFAFKDCLDHFLPIKLLLTLLFSGGRKNNSTFDAFTANYGSDETKEFLTILCRGLFINVKMCPAQYLVIGVVLVGKALFTSSVYKLRSQIEGTLVAILH